MLARMEEAIQAAEGAEGKLSAIRNVVERVDGGNDGEVKAIVDMLEHVADSEKELRERTERDLNEAHGKLQSLEQQVRAEEAEKEKAEDRLQECQEMMASLRQEVRAFATTSAS